MEWLKMWDEKANTENYFTQTGRGKSFTMYEFLLYIQDVNNNLHLCKGDNLLDIGGGSGWVSMHLSPWVNSIIMIDYSDKMIEKAGKQVTAFENIKVFYGNVLNIRNWDFRYEKGFNKILVGSVFQYLANMDEVRTALQNIYNVMKPGGKCLLTHNPDLNKKESHIASMLQTEETLQQENARLWINPQEMMYMSLKAGFSECLIKQINPLIWQSTHMFDMLVIK